MNKIYPEKDRKISFKIKLKILQKKFGKPQKIYLFKLGKCNTNQSPNVCSVKFS